MSTSSASLCVDVTQDAEVAGVLLRATQAHAALMCGDVDAYRALISQTEDFTLMAPFGGQPTRGAEHSRERWAAIGRFFKDGRDCTAELVRAYRSADLIVLVLIERAHVEVGAIPAQPWALRVTLVFRRERGQWLLAHRHADPLVDGITVAQSAALARGSAAHEVAA